MTSSSRIPDLAEGSLDRYLSEISRYPLVDRETEAALARRIRAGDDEALNQLVRANLRFVVSVAKRYQRQGVPLADLINEGNLGLLRAARKFDETRGIKFISYAVWWVRQAILQAMAEQSRIVRIPLNRAGALHRVGKTCASLQQQLGRAPTPGEIARHADLSVDEVASALSLLQTHLYLDAPTASDDRLCVGDSMSDQMAISPEGEALDAALRDTVEEVLVSLHDREAKVLRLYFGLDGQEPMTLEQIGDLLGITRERVRQVKERALKRMRHASRARFLDAFLS